MKKLLVSSGALLGLTASTMAADVPRQTVVAPAPAVPVFTWTGFYAGVNAGYGFSDRNDRKFSNASGLISSSSGLAVPTLTANDLLGPPAPIVPISGFPVGVDRRSHGGFIGGGQIGYNYQFTPGSGFVVGLEIDAQYADFGRRRDADFFGFGVSGSNIFTADPVFPAGTFFPSGPGVGVDFPVPGSAGNVALFNNAFTNGFARNQIDWFGTVRGRLGYALDRVLIYVTGGGAFTDRSDRCYDGGVFNGGFGCGFGGFVNGAAVPATFFVNSVAAAAAASVSSNSLLFSNGHVRRDNDFGWTVGGGVEYAFTNNLTAKIEGLYVSFDAERHDIHVPSASDVVGVTNTGAAVTRTGFALGSLNHRTNDNFGVVRAGVNYKFTMF